MRTPSSFAFILLLVISSVSCTQSDNDKIFHNASAFWKFDKVHKGIQFNGNASIEKTVDTDTLFKKNQMNVARLVGGYIDLGQGKNNKLNIDGYEFTLNIRFRIANGKWNKTIISKGNDEDKLSWKLYGREFGTDPEQKSWDMARQNYVSFGNEEGKGYALEFLLGVQNQPSLNEGRTEAGMKRHNTFRLGVPVSMIGSDLWHNVTIRFTGPRLEMYVDGVLVDEEWPIGQLRICDDPCIIGSKDGEINGGFEGDVEYAAVWNRALTNEEVTSICGGKGKVSEAELRILGPESKSLQYWKPRGHNIWVGDVVPAYNNGRFHLFYLYDRRHHGSKWGAGAHQFSHYSSTDLTNWEKHPLALEITRQWETFGTGCPIFVDNRLELHYGLHITRFFDYDLTTGPMIREEFEKTGKYIPQPTKNTNQQWLTKDVPLGHAVAVSEDGINFRKLDSVFSTAENMCVFKSVEKRKYCLFYDNELFTSDDLREWSPANKSFLPTGNQTPANNTSECPNYFEWNGWYYILMGGSGFWMSKNELDNYWPGADKKNKNVKVPEWDISDGFNFPMVAPFKDNRRIIVGWTQSPEPHGGWGGYLVFRELIQEPEGTLGMKWPAEMIPVSGSPIKWSVEGVKDRTTENEGSVIINATKLTKKSIKGLPLSYHLSATITPGNKTEAFGIQFVSRSNVNEGCELRFDPKKEHAQWGTLNTNGLAPFIPHEVNRDSPYHPMHGTDFALEKVKKIDTPFQLEIIVKYDITSNIVLIDACIDGRRTMITHRYNLKCNTINLFSSGGEVTFSNLTIRPLS